MKEILEFVFLQKNYVSDKKFPLRYSIFFALFLSFSLTVLILMPQRGIGYSFLVIPFLIYRTLLGVVHVFIKVFVTLILLKIFNKNLLLESREFVKKYIFTYAPLLFLIPINVMGYYYDTDRGVILFLSLLIILWKYAVQINFLQKIAGGNIIKNIFIVIISDVSEIILYALDMIGFLLLFFILLG